jgi:hypothetical protein
MAKDLHSVLNGKWEEGTRPKDLYALYVSKDAKAYVKTIVDGLDVKAKRIQGGCAELASLLSADRPELLYPYVDRFLSNLSAKEPILRWEAACTTGNLAAVDTRHVIPSRIDSLVALLMHESIVLQGHAARALAKIARAYPKKAPEILEALFANVRYFPGTRVGYIVEAAESFVGAGALRPRIKELVSPYAESQLRPVASKARKVLRKLEAG